MNRSLRIPMTERKLVFYGVRFWGLFFLIDGIYRIPAPLMDIPRALAGEDLPSNWTWFWLVEFLARPVVETLAGISLLWGGAWLALLIVRNVSSAEQRTALATAKSYRD